MDKPIMIVSLPESASMEKCMMVKEKISELGFESLIHNGGDGVNIEVVQSTLRDEFAMRALPLIPFLAETVYRNPETWGNKEIAEEVYRIADAMMEARNQ